ncbi:nitrous oxide reductase accessory protein NosL [Shewanella surugensis]|uniref:Nitrous oxide reductase accessory protein NosL n=1 Tax=Shewanella surugensis TaxID=212020 RepID=A0ABT0L8M6_9GAMM|nr:nitrous oxide reductase accessory protein NosL [Shewanella surugensis]MCL1123730.1 nitrous oxide reductase accessory protein NosL [Shewanella surugensis]
MMNYLMSMLIVITPFFMGGCGGETTATTLPVVAIGQGDECHLCGMIIVNFSGPKGETYTKTSPTVKKFCSTLDLFSFLLDPEYQYQIKEIYVHDMGKTPWQSPKDSDFIDGRKAWYVVGSSQFGSMGKTLASFTVREDAETFMRKFGGQVYVFEEINMAMLKP